MNFKLLFFVLFLSGCASIYRAEEFNQHVMKTKQSFNVSMHAINDDFKNKRKVIDSLEINKADFSKFPYNKIDQLFQELTKVKENIKNEREVISENSKKVEKVFRYKTEIKNKDKEFSELKSYSDEFTQITKRIANSFDVYKSLSEQFMNLAKSSEIYLVNHQQFNNKIHEQSRRAEKKARAAQIRMRKLQRSLRNYSGENKSERQQTLARMTKLLKKISHNTSDIKKTGLAYRAQYNGERGKVVVGPHLKTNKLLVKIDQQESEVNSLLNEFNDLAETLY